MVRIKASMEFALNCCRKIQLISAIFVASFLGGVDYDPSALW